MTGEQAREELLKTEELINAVYREAGKERGPRWFRFPYLDKGGYNSFQESQSRWLEYTRPDKKEQFQELLRELGFSRMVCPGIDHRWYKEAELEKDYDAFITFDQMEYNLGNPDAPFGTGSEEAILSRIEENRPDEGRSLNDKSTADIILLHDHDSTTELFFKIIDAYLKKEFLFLLPENR